MAYIDAELTHFVSKLSDLPNERIPEFALSGRSNVGKSRLVNYLVGRKQLAKISGNPGKTRCLIYFRIENKWNLVDMPGYGYAKVGKVARREWLRQAVSYLETREQLAGVLQLIDLKVGATKLDVERVAMLSRLGRPLCLVFTKSDKLPRSKHDRAVADALGLLKVRPDTGVVLSSAVEGKGASELWAWIRDRLSQR